MFSNFPATGQFKDLNLHEMLCQLIMGRFSGSLEITSNDAVRILHFDKGLLCAATSDAHDEQLDGMLELEIHQSLNAEQLTEIEARRKKGQSFGKALVDCGFIPAMEFLEYSKRMAEIIFKRAVAGIARSYRLNQGNSLKYRPLPFDPLLALFHSIAGNYNPDSARDKLGGENISYTRSAKFDSSYSTLKDNAEIRTIINQLDGKRTVKEITGTLELDPERTAGILLFLKWMEWVEPVTADAVANNVESLPIIDIDEASLAIGAMDHNHSPGPAETLKLMEEEDEIEADLIDSSDAEGASIALDSKERMNVAVDRILGDQVKAVSGGQTGEHNRKPHQARISSNFAQKKIKGKFVFRILVPAVGSVVIVLIAAVAMFSSTSTSKTAEQPTIAATKPPAEQKAPQLPQDTSGPESGNLKHVTVSNRAVEPGIDKDRAHSLDEQPALARDKIQPMALRNCAAGNWAEAVRIWKQQLKSTSARAYTILLVSVNQDVYLESVFERFANSASLRQDFFILDGKQDKSQLFFACWGNFPDLTSAQAAVDTLPESIRLHYTPGVRSVAELTR